MRPPQQQTNTFASQTQLPAPLGADLLGFRRDLILTLRNTSSASYLHMVITVGGDIMKEETAEKRIALDALTPKRSAA